MYKQVLISCVVLVTLGFVSQADAIKCYTCVDCPDYGKDTTQVDCFTGTCLITKTDGKSDGNSLITRSCGVQGACKVAEQLPNTKCSECSTDLCNGVSNFININYIFCLVAWMAYYFR